MDTHKAVANLRTFIKALVRSRITSKEQFRRWKKKPENEKFMAACFGYRKRKGMPSVTALVEPHFHGELPLIGLNYTNVAHNTLHAFAAGWTPVLRLCRGIIFDRRGALVAFPFPKFFNAGERPETTDLPDEPFTATVKHDGHLGIVFSYKGTVRLATRVTFDGPSARLGNEMLAAIARKNGWDAAFPKDATVLVEIIHPKTKVHVDYAGREGFVLIGAYDRERLEDLDHVRLAALGSRLGLPVTERWSGSNIEDLRKLMRDPTVRNREGFVVRFAGGLRVKFKFETYIGLMVSDKLSYGYLMKRMMAGNLERMILTLPEEILGEARTMVDRIRAAAAQGGDEKVRRERLYALDPERQKNQHYRGICRKFLSQLEKAAGSAA